MHHLNTNKFDYGYNMKFNGAMFLCQFVIWIYWARRCKERPYASMAIKFEILLLSAAIFEIFDFPPVLLLLDAHAIWHFLTIPLCFYWYRFFELDADWELGSAEGHKRLA